MFDQGFTFQKGAWHARLMKYIWNLSHKDFDYMCPYFWLSVFNVIIAPVVLPIKFTLWQLIPFIWKRAIYPFMVWNYEGIERFFLAIMEKFDAWAVENQRKWDERREREITEMRGRAMEFLESIPEKILDTGILLTQRQLWMQDSVNHAKPEEEVRWQDERNFWDYYEAMSKKEKRMWQIMKGVVRKNSKAPIKIVETIKERNSPEYNGTFSPFIYVPETPEEAAERLRRDIQRKAAIDKRKAEEEAKEAEKQRVEQLRKEEAEKKRLADREKWLIRQQKRESQRLRNKQRINAILKFAKPIATAVIWIVGVLVAIVGIILLAKGIIWIAEGFGSVKQTTYSSIGKWIGIILKWTGIAALAIGAIIGIVALCQYIKENVRIPRLPKWMLKKYEKPAPEETPEQMTVRIRKQHVREEKWDDFWEKVGNVFRVIGGVFVSAWKVVKFISKFVWKVFKLIFITPFVKIWKGLVVFIQIIRQTYNDNCPPIKWKD